MIIPKRLSTGLIDIVFPPFCHACGIRLAPDERGVCGKCWKSVEPTNLGNWRNDVTYHEGLDWVLTGWFINDVLLRILHELKYNEKRAMATELGTELGRMFGEQIDGMDIRVVIPVPLHRAKRRHRGYNQSDLLGRSLARELNLAYETALLVRRRNTVSQTALPIGDRLTNVAGAFKVKHLHEHKRLLLVDDVVTTGATLSSCASAIHAAGGEFVGAITAGTPYFDRMKS